MVSKMIKQFVSSIDQVVIDYYVEDGQLSYKTEGTEDFQDFTPYDRAYSKAENLELMSLLYATY